MMLEVPAEFSLMAVVVVAAFMAHMFMSSGVVKARKKYGVQYPTMYALESEIKEAKMFNCVQRGHQNFLEIVSFFFALLILAGLQHPRIATVAGLFFLVARITYFNDYSSGDPKKRMRGAAMGYLSLMVLIGCSISLTVHQLFL